MTPGMKFDEMDRILLLEHALEKVIAQIGFIREQIVDLQDGLEKCFEYIERKTEK